jgi:ribosomal protein L31
MNTSSFSDRGIVHPVDESIMTFSEDINNFKKLASQKDEILNTEISASYPFWLQMRNKIVNYRDSVDKFYGSLKNQRLNNKNELRNHLKKPQLRSNRWRYQMFSYLKLNGLLKDLERKSKTILMDG